MRFSSPTPFALCEEAASLPAAHVVEAQRCFAAGCGTQSLGLQQQWAAALLSYQYPQDPWAAGGGGGARGALAPALAARWHSWQGAFASLFDALRGGRCDAFYFVAPEASGGGGG